MPISRSVERKLQSWQQAALIDEVTAGRIRAYEESDTQSATRWQVWLAVSFGAMMVAAGVLLFVAAHWDELSPGQRFTLVIILTAAFHLAAGAVGERMKLLATALHGVGTATLGAGIFLAGQIFNLQEHWPNAVLMWAVGALIAWAFLRDAVQATTAALLFPAWMISEWSQRTIYSAKEEALIVQFLAVLAIVYMGAALPGENSSFHRALNTVGCIAVLPASIWVAVWRNGTYGYGVQHPLSTAMLLTGYVGAYLLPMLFAWLLRRQAALWPLCFVVWVLVLSQVPKADILGDLFVYLWCAVGSIALVYWGVREARNERINLGVAAFAITICAFYFSTVMDKLGRSASLIAFGLLFLLGGWKLEQFRRKLTAKTREVAR